MKNEDTQEAIEASFKIFEKPGSGGKVSVQELKHVLITIGEKLSEDEFDEMIKEADFDNKTGLISINSFVSMLLSK
jgi:Ca2+-binding EF-hand superfamily protein